MSRRIAGIALFLYLFGVVSGKTSGAAAGEGPVRDGEIRSLIRAYVSERLALPLSEIDVQLLGDAGARFDAASPSRLAIREANGTSLLGVGMFLMVSDDPSVKMAPVWMNARCEWVHQAVAASRQLKKNQIVSAEDLVIETIHSDQPGDYFSRTEEVVGKRVVQQERIGTVLMREMIQTPPLFTQGERVTLLIETGNLRIEASGKALEDGYAGKPVSVMNLDSHRTVYGDPLDAATVRVRTGHD